MTLLISTEHTPLPMTSSLSFSPPDPADAACPDANELPDAPPPPAPVIAEYPPASLGVGSLSSWTPPPALDAAPPFRELSSRLRPHAMMLNLGPPIPRVSFGTPCLNRLFTCVVNAKTSPLRCGNENCVPDGSCRNVSSRSPPKDAP